MKIKYIVVIILMFGYNNSKAQEFKNQTIRQLMIGDSIPDIKLGEFITDGAPINKFLQGKTKWSELKGKLIILDFWGTFCGSCIASFPELSHLQSQFKDEIVIILVNPYESKEIVEKWLLRKRNDQNGRSILPANLNILLSKDLREMFPGKGAIPYHVWISQNGVVALRGIAENSNYEKIKTFLNGKSIKFIVDNPTKTLYQKTSFFDKIDSTNLNLVYFNSYLGKFTEKLANPHGTGGQNIIDSINGVKRTTFLNCPIDYMFFQAWKDVLKMDKSILYGKPIALEVENASLFSRDKIFNKTPITDETYEKTGYCYEQVVPLSTPDSIKSLFMKQDLNRNFNILFGISASIENRKIKCYRLIKNKALLKFKSSQPKTEFFSSFDSNGKMLRVYKSCSISDIFIDYFASNNITRQDMLIVDDTNFKEEIDITLPSLHNLKSLDNLKSELNKFGLDLVEGLKDVDLLVIKEHR